MGWNRADVADAICTTLDTAAEGSVATFPDPPPSFNVPAYIVAWPTNVSYNAPVYGVDLATLPLIVAVAENQSGYLDTLLDLARQALANDPTLGGLLSVGVLIVTDQRNWRVLADVAGSRFLAAELILEIRQ